MRLLFHFVVWALLKYSSSEETTTTPTQVDDPTSSQLQDHQRHEAQGNDCIRLLASSCDPCDTSSSQEGETEYNVEETHKSGRPFLCEICGYQFKFKSDLTRHMSKHSDEISALCHLCGFGSKYLYYLEQHMKCHSEKKPFSCGICERAYKSRHSLRKHTKSHKGYTLLCRVCDKKFESECTLYSHAKDTHADKKSLNVCHICDRSLSSKGNLRRHMKTHTTKETFSCTICQKSVKTKKTLARHMKFHGRQPYSCTVCDRKFSTTEDLARPIEYHELEYQRSICHKKYHYREWWLNRQNSRSDTQMAPSSDASERVCESAIDDSVEDREGEEPILEVRDMWNENLMKDLVRYTTKEEVTECYPNRNGECLDAFGMPACGSRSQNGDPPRTAATNTVTRAALSTMGMDSCELEIDSEEPLDLTRTEQEITACALDLSRSGDRGRCQHPG